MTGDIGGRVPKINEKNNPKFMRDMISSFFVFLYCFVYILYCRYLFYIVVWSLLDGNKSGDKKCPPGTLEDT